MPKAPPCSQYEPPAHILVVPKSGRAQYCRKSTAGQKRRPRKPKANRVPRLPAAPVVAVHPMNLPVAIRKPKAVRVPRKPKAPRLPAAPVVKRHPANRPKAPANSNKGKFLVSMKFNLRNTRNQLNNNNGPFGMSEANKKLVKNAKLPTNKEFSAYMNRMNVYNKIPFYEAYLRNLYSYGNYGETPKVRNYKNATVRFVIDPTKKGFNGNVVFPSAQSIKNNLAGQSLANGIWAAGPGGHGVYPVKTSNGLSELGVIGFKNVKVSKI